MTERTDEMPPRWAEVYFAAWILTGGALNATASDLLTADREEVAARCAKKHGGTVAGWRGTVDAALDAIGGDK
jgi:hypothetical protein